MNTIHYYNSPLGNRFTIAFNSIRIVFAENEIIISPIIIKNMKI